MIKFNVCNNLMVAIDCSYVDAKLMIALVHILLSIVYF